MPNSNKVFFSLFRAMNKEDSFGKLQPTHYQEKYLKTIRHCHKALFLDCHAPQYRKIPIFKLRQKS